MSSEENEKKTIETKKTKELYFSYFIGRCNPPHQGHFHMIREAIVAANRPEVEGKALILLGSGPKAKIGIDRRTEKDPLTFDLKKEIIEKNITNCVEQQTVFSNVEKHDEDNYEIDEDKYEIFEMTNPTAQVIEFVETELESQLKNDDNTSLIKITVQHFAGAKENDATKLEFIRRALENKIKEDYNIQIETEPVTFCLDTEDTKDTEDTEDTKDTKDTVIPMSATSIRDDVNKTDLGIDQFKDKYKIYGDDAGTVYNAIKEGK